MSQEKPQEKLQEKKKFVWYELATTATEAAAAFYRDVIGWSTQDAGMTPPYTLFSMGGSMVAGLMAMPEEAAATGARPSWLGHIGVDDLDASLAQLAAAGGTVDKPPQEIPGVGRFAVVADPHGAVFLLFQSTVPPRAPAANSAEPGQVGWVELHAGDLDTSWPFYAGLFGWTKDVAVDMGPMGIYQTFETGGIGGGMMTKMPETPAPFWLYYINVDAIDGAVARATKAGAELLMGPHQVPGGSWIAQCFDPQGVLFAMVSPVR